MGTCPPQCRPLNFLDVSAKIWPPPGLVWFPDISRKAHLALSSCPGYTWELEFPACFFHFLPFLSFLSLPKVRTSSRWRRSITPRPSSKGTPIMINAVRRSCISSVYISSPPRRSIRGGLFICSFHSGRIKQTFLDLFKGSCYSFDVFI